MAIKPGQCEQAVPDCMVLGEANVLIFPDMQSGNIAYKLVGHLGQREVIGPLLYGWKQPINMVSTNSTVEKIVNVAVCQLMRLVGYKLKVITRKKVPAKAGAFLRLLGYSK